MPVTGIGEAWEAALEAMKAPLHAEPEYLVFPAWRLPQVQELKASYVRVGIHGTAGVRGIRFTDEWPTIGQVFTYDNATGEWDR